MRVSEKAIFSLYTINVCTKACTHIYRHTCLRLLSTYFTRKPTLRKSFLMHAASSINTTNFVNNVISVNFLLFNVGEAPCHDCIENYIAILFSPFFFAEREFLTNPSSSLTLRSNLLCLYGV